MRPCTSVVGDLMFADNFYIALYDADERTLNYPYYRDEVDLDIPDPEAWEPMGTGQARGLTAYVLRTGMTQLVTKERFHQLIADGEIEQVGEDGEDWVGVPLNRRRQVDRRGSSCRRTKLGSTTRQEDVDLLTFVGQHVASALSRARAIAETKRLLLETKQRAAELTLINGVQSGLAARLDSQRMYDLVGDKIQQFFDAQVVDIGIVDPEVGVIRFPYTIERGVRFPDEPIPVMGIREHVLETREPLLINERVAERARRVRPAGGDPGRGAQVVRLRAGHRRQRGHRRHLPPEPRPRERVQRVGPEPADDTRRQPEPGARQRPAARRAASPRGRPGHVNSVGQAISAQLDPDALIQPGRRQGPRRRSTPTSSTSRCSTPRAARSTSPTTPRTAPRERPESIAYGEGWTSQVLMSREPLLINSEEERDTFETRALGTLARFRTSACRSSSATKRSA